MGEVPVREVGPLRDWVAGDVTRRKSIFLPGVKFPSYERMLNVDGQEWRVEGVPSNLAVCSSFKKYKFFVYSIMLDELRV